MTTQFLKNFYTKSRVHIYALLLGILLITGITLCYYSSDKAIKLDPDKWNMEAISIVY